MRDEINNVWVTVYSVGMDTFLETRWFCERGLIHLMENNRLCDQSAAGPLRRARSTGRPQQFSTVRPPPLIILVPSRLERPRASRRCTQKGIHGAADIAGQYVDQHKIEDVTNAGNNPGVPIIPDSQENRGSS